MKHLATCLLFALSLFGATYEVGPGKTYADPLNLPWTHLTDGDTIRIYWRVEPYRTMLFIGWSDFTVEGVPGPTGERPVLDGDGATVVTQGIEYYNHDRGIIRIGESKTPAVKLLRNIRIEGLELRNAWGQNSNKGYHGQTTPNASQPWGWNAAGIQATGVDGLIVRNNYIHETKIAVQVNGNYPGRPSSNCLVENNEFANIGGYSDDQSHVLYLECNGERVRHNKSTQPPGWSSVYKSRGTCTEVTDNWGLGGDRVVDLVESGNTRSVNPTCPDVVANNYFERFDGLDNDAFIHFGGDGPNLDYYRKNTLQLLNNTFVSRRGGSVLVRVSAWNQTVVALNNVFQWTKMARGGFLLAMHNEFRRSGPNGEKAKISYGSNWFQKGSCSDPTAAMYLCGRVGDLDATDLGGNTWAVSAGAENTPPSATPVWGADYRPLYNSPLLDAGSMDLAGVDWTFAGSREIINGKIDIGALEYGSTRKPGLQAASVISIPPVAVVPTTPPSTPQSSTIEQTIFQLKTLVDNAAKAKKLSDDAAAAAAAAITEAKAAAARAEYDATTVADKYVQQIRKVLEDAGLK